MIADVVSQHKGVEYIFPVAAGDANARAMLIDPFPQPRVSIRPEGPEMDIFNPADVITLIDINARKQRLAIDAGDIMPPRQHQMHPLVWIGQGHVQHREVVSRSVLDGPRVGRRRRGLHVLLGIINSQTANGDIIAIAGQKGMAVRFAPAFGRPENGSGIADKSRRRVEHALERGLRGQGEVAFEKVAARRNGRDAAAPRMNMVQRFLERGGIVLSTIAEGAKITDVDGKTAGSMGGGFRDRGSGDGGAATGSRGDQTRQGRAAQKTAPAQNSFRIGTDQLRQTCRPAGIGDFFQHNDVLHINLTPRDIGI